MSTQNELDQSEGWLTIQQAARALGKSDLTIRRRIKDGSLPSRLAGGKYWVRLSDRETAGPAKTQPPDVDDNLAGQGSPPAASGPSLDLSAVLSEQARLAEQAGRAALLEEQLRALEQRYATLQDGAITLATRNGWLESKLEERENEIKLLEDSRRRRPAWWKRLLGAS
ncbi:MAG TPA: hypothetical protein VFB58_15185 [Chloroflexota bacterium]|nr:hypothetical protein [Chloroflexota bacterium]